VFTGRELCAECLLASAAIPELFRAVTVPGRGQYWDGLFSQNPPIHDLVQFNINELWVIQINASACIEVPKQVGEIKDRRNALGGNLSMEQELRFIESINRGIAQGVISSERFHPIAVSRIPMDRDFGYRSKMSRSPDFLEELQQYGRTKGRLFLKERQRKLYTLQAVGAVSKDL
jgi:NTE family protein